MLIWFDKSRARLHRPSDQRRLNHHFRVRWIPNVNPKACIICGCITGVILIWYLSYVRWAYFQQPGTQHSMACHLQVSAVLRHIICWHMCRLDMVYGNDVYSAIYIWCPEILHDKGTPELRSVTGDSCYNIGVRPYPLCGQATVSDIKLTVDALSYSVCSIEHVSNCAHSKHFVQFC